MSRMFVFSKREQLAFLRAAITEQGQNPDEVMINEGYEFNVNSEPLAMAARIVRLVSKDFLELRRYARDNIGNTRFAFSAPIMYGSKPDTVRVFTNISMTGSAGDDIYKYCSPFFCYDEAIPNFLAQLKADLGDERRSQAWATINRSWRRIKRYEEMTLARAVSRFSNAKELGIKDDMVRNFAQYVEDMRRPLEVTFADKPEDFMIMYGSGPSSCMALNNNGNPDDNGPEWRPMLRAGHCPTSFFAYHPHTRGAYITRGGKVVTRCIVYETEKGWRWGRIYPGGDMWSLKLQKALSDMGMQQLTDSFARDCEFSIPGIKLDGRKEYICPTPYFDNMRGTFDVDFDDKTKVFHFHHYAGNKGKTSGLGGTGGYISSRHYVNLTCDHCNRRMNADHAIHSDVDDRVFCSHEHAIAAGLVVARRSDGMNIYTRADDPNLYRTLDGTLFTNRPAAEATALRAQLTFVDENENLEFYATSFIQFQRSANTSGSGAWESVAVADTRTNRDIMNRVCSGYRILASHAPRMRSGTITMNTVRSMPVPDFTVAPVMDLVVLDGVAPVTTVEWMAPAEGVIPVAAINEFTTVLPVASVRIAA